MPLGDGPATPPAPRARADLEEQLAIVGTSPAAAPVREWDRSLESGNQRIDQWIKWWVCFADAVGSNLEWAGNLLRKCALYMPYDVEEG
jgi:hypothetical protein